jgi:hypothetical protein
MTRWTELGRMNFEQFEQFVSLHGGRPHKFKETISDSVVSMMQGATKFVEYRCDNVRLWCRSREPAVAGWLNDENLVLTV